MLWCALLLAALGQGSKEERGKFKLTYFGREAGAEEFRIEEFEDGHVAVFSKARFEIEIQGQKRPYVTDTALTLDKDWAPMLYAGYQKIGAEERLAKLEWKKGVVVVDRKREVRTSAGFVADNNVFAHLVALLRRYGGGKKKVKVFNPTALADMEAGIEDLGEVTLHGTGRAVQVREFRLAMGTLGTVTAHVDAAKRVVRAWNPMVAGLAELEGFEGLSKEPSGGVKPVGLEEEVGFPGGAIRLAGTVTRPKEGGPFPAVALLSDAGPHDRDGGPGWDGFRRLAHGLSGAGILVLRVDDRGCGRSGGDAGKVRLTDLASDARSSVEYLLGRKDVSSVGLVGHGEGGVVAGKAAAGDAKVRAVFLLAAPARPWDAVLLERLERRLRGEGMKDELVEAALNAERKLFDRIRKSEGDILEIDERPTFVAGLREHFGHDPAEQIRTVKAKVVVFQGMKDAEVGPDHADRYLEARPDADVRRFEFLDHLFMPVRGRPGDLADSSRTLDPEFVKILGERILEHLK
jgi:hypothetical protein